MMANLATLDFIRHHADDDVRQLALQGAKWPDVDMRYALDQIAGRQKARVKLPSWAAIDGIVYPPHLSMEQCSSEQTACYTARLAGEGGLFVDLTAGFGVDAAFIAKGFKRAVTVERQQQLCDIASQNYRTLGLGHIETVCGDGVDYLHSLQRADLIFVDPARRDEHGARTYGLADCTPNILEIVDEMAEKACRVMIKLSPMLDWQKAVADVGRVGEVHIVSVGNECKELLLMVSKEPEPLHVYCVNDGSVFDFEPQLPVGASAVSCAAPRYLYEPNASVMKAGCFDLLSERYQMPQLDRNSHLFVSEAYVTDFPGRCFEIERVLSMNKRQLKEGLGDIKKANITVRNFPMTVVALRQRLRLQEGGDTYIFATTVAKTGHQLFVCRKKS